jgi:meso-butanediol dehydrogenase/(S,S)-butanediol dehydrogenase/diacetyl reductase
MVLVIPGRFEGKVIAITGGASGVGEALTRRYVSEGAKVLVADRCDTEKGTAFASEFPKGSVYFHQCDIGEPEGATGVVTMTVTQFGRIDIVHNNASAFAWGTIPEMDPASWKRVFQVGVDGPFYICRAAITQMIKQGGGAIVNTLSTSGLNGDVGLGCYCAAKAALANLTRAMAADHALENVRINAIAPGWIDTPMAAALSATPEIRALVAHSTPMRRPADPREIASVAMFLASDDASFVTGSSMFSQQLHHYAHNSDPHLNSLYRRWRTYLSQQNAFISRSPCSKHKKPFRVVAEGQGLIYYPLSGEQ